MRLFLFTCLAMLAFAANSVLSRMALADGAMDPLVFAMIRLAAGAAALALLVVGRRLIDRQADLARLGRARRRGVWSVGLSDRIFPVVRGD